MRDYRFEVYEDSAGSFRWRLVEQNGQVTGGSQESYTRRRDCRRAVRAVKRGVLVAKVVEA